MRSAAFDISPSDLEALCQGSVDQYIIHQTSPFHARLSSCRMVLTATVQVPIPITAGRFIHADSGGLFLFE